MPATPHVETHFQASDIVRDIVIGMSDGLTVPFALAAGLSGTTAASSIIVVAGLAEIAAGSIAMGLGGYLAAKTDLDHYRSERQRESRETLELPEKESEEVAEIFTAYGLAPEHVGPVVAAIKSDRERWIDFMMRFELGFEAPDPNRARQSALTIAFSYIAGGLVPLTPYMIFSTAETGLMVSAAVTLVALFFFGFFKARFTGIHPLRGGMQTLVIGGLASAAAYGLAKLIS